jgi:hypothetical protein
VVHQLRFYKEQSRIARTRYQVLEILIVCVAASIPAAAAFGASRAALGLLGAVATVLAGLRTIFRYKDNSAAFTRALNAIEDQLVLFRHHADPYRYDDKLEMLTDEQRSDRLCVNVRHIVGTETDDYAARLRAARVAQGSG